MNEQPTTPEERPGDLREIVSRVSGAAPWETDNLVRAIDEYIDQRLNTHAHELAASIRTAWAEHDAKKPGNVCMLSALNAADFIDPKETP